MNRFPRVAGEAQTVQHEAEQEETSGKPDDEGVLQSGHAGWQLHHADAAGPADNGDRCVEVESAGERGAEQLAGEDDATAYHSGKVKRAVPEWEVRVASLRRRSAPCRPARNTGSKNSEPGLHEARARVSVSRGRRLDGAGGLGPIRTEGVGYCLPFLTCSMT